jgi:hypothetical protein
MRELMLRGRNVEMCPDCRQGPSGIQGHDSLFSHTMSAERMQFICRTCTAIWVRHYGSEGTFVWAPPAGERPGMDTPGRPGTARP